MNRSATVKLRFVTSPNGNHHMTDLLAGLAAAAREGGHDAELEVAGFPRLEPDTAYLVIPHEYYGTEPCSAWPSREQREQTIALCVENPTTQWFEAVCDLAPQFPRVIAINRSSVSELRRRGIVASHLQLGYTPHWDRWNGTSAPRPIDVTYLGAADARRDALVAGYGRWLWGRRTAMFVPPTVPKPSMRADYLVGRAKYEHLSQSKLLVNLHRQDSSSFEWVRALEAMANGCVVVSEPSSDHGPLVPGEHLVIADAESIPHVIEALLREPERLAQIRQAAYEMVRGPLSMQLAVEGLAATARELLNCGAGRTLPTQSPALRPEPTSHVPAPADESARLRNAVRTLATETIELRRTVELLLARSEGRALTGEPEVVAVTPSFPEARPRVSVAVTVHNYELEVQAALASVEVSEFEDYEILVLDDASADRSRDSVLNYLAERPWLPAALLHHPVNRGLGASRNALARHARGEMMFVLDADNVILPTALGRLVDALDRDPGASFAYPLIAVTRSEQPIGLLSSHAWDPDGFQTGNYIDAMAMIRLDDFWALGGYTEDARLTSWEDFHLWCAHAESGRRGVLVPEVLARYRKADHSMLAWTQTDVSTAWSLMHARFPGIVPAAHSG